MGLMMSGSTPIFASADVEATIAYYKDVIGFTSSWTWGDPVSFGGVHWENVAIMFALQPEIASVVQGHQHWFNVEDVDSLYGSHRERGANIVDPIADRPWGVREYVVEDLAGYRLRFAGAVQSASRPSTTLPAGVSIVRRKPTAEEYAIVSEYDGNRDQSVFDDTWQGIVALSSDGEVIGTTRIMRDSTGWYSIWDVAVAPAWQGRRIGESLMKEALAVIREVAPGSHVHLFTTKPGFYERLGFKTETVTMRRV